MSKEPIGIVMNNIIKECKGYKTIPQFLNDVACAFNLPTWDWGVEEVGDRMEVTTRAGDVVFEIELGDRDTIYEVFTYFAILVPEAEDTEDVEPIICPLCESGEMEYRSLPNPQAYNEFKVTHIWVCEECPNVMLEWYSRSDTEAMLKHFN